MAGEHLLRRLMRGDRIGLLVGAVMLALALGGRSWLLGLIALGLLARAGWRLYRDGRTASLDQPWPWPPDLRAQAEAMARAVDPTPKRLLPPHEKASAIARVATTKEDLSRLIADKPPAWPWALFTSVLVQRRNAVQGRLRTVASGYQPRAGLPPISGQAYAQVAYGVMRSVADLVGQLEQFMLSPAFKGAFGEAEAGADADAIVAIANRLMDYHEAFLVQAETCLQTPVQSEAHAFVADMGAFTLCPLAGFEQFIATMCARIGEAQDLLPYADPTATIALDDAQLAMTLPDGLSERITAHVGRFTA